MVQYDSENTKVNKRLFNSCISTKFDAEGPAPGPWLSVCCSYRELEFGFICPPGCLTGPSTPVLGTLIPALESMGFWTHMGYAGRSSRMHMCPRAPVLTYSKSILFFFKIHPRKILPLRKMAPSAGCFLECLSVFSPNIPDF